MLKQMFRGALAGTLATVPMTGVMLAIYKALPDWQHYEIPPKILTTKIVEGAGFELSETEEKLSTAVAHLGYGAAVGLPYPFLARWAKGPGSTSGMAYGLLVWYLSYAGWVPAMGLLPGAEEKPRGRNLMMILSHLMWGAVTGALVARWQEAGAAAAGNRQETIS